MKIHGIGTDISNIRRIKKLIKNKNIVNRLFHPKEIEKCKKQKNASNCFAKRFAAKEAFTKALGTGIAKGINFKEICVNNIKSGKPNLELLGSTKKKTKKILKKKNFDIFLSLSDDKPFAIATVIISL